MSLVLLRAVIADAGKSGLGKLYFEPGWGAAWEPIAARLAKAVEQSRLRGPPIRGHSPLSVHYHRSARDERAQSRK